MSSSQPLIQSTNPLGEDGIVRCHHGERAVRRTSHTASNTDREFYCCSRHSSDSTRCKFFYWADDPMFWREELHPPSQEQMVNPYTHRTSQHVRGIAARTTEMPQSTPQTQGSAAALESPGKKRRLEDIQAGLAQVSEVTGLSTQPSTQGSSQLSQGEPLNTPQSSPSKKYSSSSAVPETPGKRKRIEDIEAGLRSAKGTRTPQPSPRKPGSSFVPSIIETPGRRARLEAVEGRLTAGTEGQTAPRAGPSFHARAAIARPSSTAPSLAHAAEVFMPPSSFPACPSSPASTNIDWDRELPPATPTHARYSFLGLPPSQDSTAPVVGQATPKNRPLSPLLDFNGNFNSDRPNSLLPTPPQTTQRRTGPTLTYPVESNGNSRGDPRTRRQGKERAHPERDGFVEIDEENPFDDTTSAYRARTRAQESNTLSRLTRPAPRTSLDSDGSPTTTDQIAEKIVGMSEPIRALQAHLDSLEQLDAIKYIEKLDREKQALSLRYEAKRKHIEAMSVELDAVREQLRKSEENCRVKDAVIEALQGCRPP
ncbi:hypothetical protein PAXRUDRAFT_824568 [Paxillus rubicundulus Ve08.2h10]|uniref:GRF-type domain-containing protein n=1 Tax=Paxillus rubicundulus Ve08.2h10 TaxID=930991 RepID=A0A0D0DHN4_9AGAM|nr:hypothetical protein PAXRUDRAFT_824568 [Paxillus rubicundulus Ve08.2h10]